MAGMAACMKNDESNECMKETHSMIRCEIGDAMHEERGERKRALR